jgi:hypothetical protein
MGYTSGNTTAQQCAGTVQGLFVPSHQIRSWINTKLKTIPNEKELMTYTTLFGRVTALGNNEAGTGLLSVRVKAEEYLDNGLGMATDFEFTAKICGENCPHQTVRQGTLAVNESVVAKVYKVGEEFYLHTIAFDTVAPLSQFKFKGMIESFGSEVTSYGRKLRPVRFAKAQADSSADKLVFTGERMEALLCTSGCSKSSVIGSSVNLVEGQGVTATVDFVEGSGVYLRNIEANVAFNRNPPVAPSAAPAPSVVSDDEEDEDDEEGAPRRRRRSSESPCAE